MKIPDPAPATSFHYRAVHMAWPGLTPVFESYIPGANSGGGIDGRFVTPGTTRAAETSSSYASPFNKVVIVVKASDLGLNPSDAISGFVSGVSQSSDPANIGAGATALYDQMPDSLSFAGSYIVNDNSVCAAAGGQATHFSISAPANAVPTTPFNVTVTALDASNNTATGYNGTAHFTSSDSQATLPGDYA